MPTYEFRCPAGHTFDRFMKMSESVPELPCPECGEVALRQMSGGAGLVFKGSGFYLTDYGRNAHRTSGPANAGAGGGGESKSGGESKGSGDSKSSGESTAPAPPSGSKTPSSGGGASGPAKPSGGSSGGGGAS